MTRGTQKGNVAAIASLHYIAMDSSFEIPLGAFSIY